MKLASQPVFGCPNRLCGHLKLLQTKASETRVLDLKMQLWHSLRSTAPPHVTRNVTQNTRPSFCFSGRVWERDYHSWCQLTRARWHGALQLSCTCLYHVMPNINSVGSRVLKCSTATMTRLRTIIIGTAEPLSCNHDSVGIFVYISWSYEVLRWFPMRTVVLSVHL